MTLVLGLGVENRCGGSPPQDYEERKQEPQHFSNTHTHTFFPVKLTTSTMLVQGCGL